MEIDEMIRIKQQRGYSIRQIAEYSGVPEGTVRKIFSGQTENPRVATIIAIQKVLEGDESVYQGKNYLYDKNASEYEFFNESSGKGRSNMVAETAFSYGQKRSMTVSDVEKLPEECRCELIDGVIYDMGTASIEHQDIVFEVATQINSMIDKRKYKVIVNPGVRILKDDYNLLVPDVAIVCRNKVKIGRYIEGTPAFCMEVVSQWSRQRDYVTKLSKYSEAGVDEYWIVDPFKKMITIYTESENYTPEIIPIKGERALTLSGDPAGESKESLKLDLDEIAAIIDNYDTAE
ncbi:MAG: Uma2 family endonuclease [Firmicutes bacterium]|nr:Uma2 family endonuclease [Bacillota bacterium]